MVLRWGMSDKVGNVDYAETHQGYGGQTLGGSVSAATKELIESEVRRFIEEAYTTAQEVLSEKKDDWETLAKGLLEYETLTGSEITELVKGNPPVRESSEPPSKDDTPSGAVPVTDDEEETVKAKKPSGGPAPQGA
jgi:cell division protease FtsH